MLPIYILYFAGDSSENKKHKTILNSLGFVLGFTIIFVLLGAFAGTVGGFLREYKTAFNIVTGVIVIIFGLNFLEILRIPFLNGNYKMGMTASNLKFLSSVIFGMVFSIGWTPCVGAFLGSALMMAGQQGGTLQGILMLLFYSAGLGVPFIISAVLIDKLKTVFDIIKRNYKIINIVSGIFLIVIGILMMTGFMGYFLSLLTF
jgi:cytochrome c-type biogenesis protein